MDVMTGATDLKSAGINVAKSIGKKLEGALSDRYILISEDLGNYIHRF